MTTGKTETGGRRFRANVMLSVKTETGWKEAGVSVRHQGAWSKAHALWVKHEGTWRNIDKYKVKITYNAGSPTFDPLL